MIERWRSLSLEQRGEEEDHDLADLIQAQAAQMDLCKAEPLWDMQNADSTQQHITKLYEQILELEYALIPHGMHVVGSAPSESERVDLLSAIAIGSFSQTLPDSAIIQLVQGKPIQTIMNKNKDFQELVKEEAIAILDKLQHWDQHIQEETKIPSILKALNGRFIRPAPDSDVMRNPEVLCLRSERWCQASAEDFATAPR